MSISFILDHRMAQNLIFLPVLAQVLLTFTVLIVMGVRRRRSAMARGQAMQDLALAGPQDWDKPALQAANNFKNQFELPVLFYVVAAFALMTRNVDMVFFLIACLFVVSRVAHTAFHLGDNIVARRGGAYLVGFALLLALWIMLAVRIVWSGF